MRGERKIFKSVILDWTTLVALLGCLGIIWGTVWVFKRMAASDAQKREESRQRDEESRQRAATIARFRPFLQQYSRYPTHDDTHSGSAYVRGKALAVGLGRYRVDWRPEIFGGKSKESFEYASYEVLEQPQPFIDGLYFELPEDIRASTPAEVQTRFLLEWSRDEVGFYKPEYSVEDNTTRLPKAYRFKCTLTISDDTKGTIVGRMEFVGGMPPPKTSGNNEGFGRLPLEQIVKAVANLPRK